jgi:hypothetical protein
MLRNLLAKLGLRQYPDEESYRAQTTRIETASQDRIDSSQRRSGVDDSPLAPQTGEEPPAESES